MAVEKLAYWIFSDMTPRLLVISPILLVYVPLMNNIGTKRKNIISIPNDFGTHGLKGKFDTAVPIFVFCF